MKIPWKEFPHDAILYIPEKGGEIKMYDEQEAGMPITKQCLDANPSPLEQLKRQRVFHKERLADIDAAINALESNPEVCKVLELIAKARR